MRLQAGLGVVASNSTSKDRTWNNGTLVVGEVIRVHHKRNTVDVKFLNTSQMASSSASNEGTNACKVLVSSAGYDTKYGKPYGVINSLQPGNLVLVGFIKNQKSSPVVLGVLHDTSEDVGNTTTRNILSAAYPIESEEDKYRETKINRVQDFVTVDGVGNFELYSHTKSFFVGTNKVDEVNCESFDFNELSLRNLDTTPLEIEEKDSRPLKFLAVFRRFFHIDMKDSLRIFIDPLKTLFRLMKIQSTESKMSIIAIDEDGAIHLRRNQDTDSYSDDSDNFTDIAIEEDGTVKVEVSSPLKTTVITVANNKVNLSTENAIEITTKSDITLSGRNLDLNGTINLEGTTNIKGTVKVDGSIISSGTMTDETPVILQRDETQLPDKDDIEE